MLPLLVNSSLSVGRGLHNSSSGEAKALRRLNSATIMKIIPRSLWSGSKERRRGIRWSGSKERRRVR
uniref:Uncharacterized protein n=1 Tax=Arundo donax TaxID=35708 RepID=A0A0A8Z421_ARUDO